MKAILALLAVVSGGAVDRQMAGKDPAPGAATCSGDPAAGSPQGSPPGTPQVQQHAISTKGTGVSGRSTGGGGDNGVVDDKSAQRKGDSLQRTGSIVQLRTGTDASGESPPAGGTEAATPAPTANGASAEKSRHECSLNSIRNIRG
jgi:hypothetical protein